MELIIIFILILLIIGTIVYNLVRLSKQMYNKDNEVKSFVKTKIYLLSIILIILISVIIYLSYLIYTNSQKAIAHQLILLGSEKKTPTMLEKADNLCEKLFEKASDKGIRDQFFDMKNKRPIEEVRNMCYNYARSLTN